MNTVLIIVLISIIFGGSVEGNKTQHECLDSNSEWTDCGTYCPKVCGKNTTEICVTLCKPGCQCKPGYILESVNGSCIPESQCKHCKDPNAEWTNCSNCQRICGKPSPLVCQKPCTSGCQCKPGYILEKENGRCIPNQSCKPCKDPNSEWVICVVQCPQTCFQSNNITVICPLILCEGGCQCKSGYILDKNTLICIPKCICYPQSCFGIN